MILQRKTYGENCEDPSLEERVDKAEDTLYYTEHRRFHDATMLFVERRLCTGVYVCASIIVGVFALMIQLYVQYSAGGSVRPRHSCCLAGWLATCIGRARYLCLYIQNMRSQQPAVADL